MATSTNSLHTNEDGKVTLVSIFAVMGMIVLIGYVGNAGHAVITKTETQNAADAVAFSNAQWVARGMNAVTATNHMLGEVTALVTIMESLGGPEADVGIKDYPPQSKTLDSVIRSLGSKAPIRGLPTYVPPPLTTADGRVIDFVVNIVSPKDKNRATHRAFATIYDAKITIKRDLATRLTVKTIANVGLFVPPPWGYLTAAAAYIAHIDSSIEIVTDAKEWLILHALELIVVNLKSFKVTILEKQLIPALSAHGAFIAGVSPKTKEPQADKGIVNVAMGHALLHLQEQYDVKAAVFPNPTKFRLPIEAEPKPTLRGGPDEPEWGSDDPLPTSADEGLEDMQDEVRDRKRKIRRRILELQAGARMLDQEEQAINERLAEDENLQANDRQALNEEKEAIQQSRQQKQKKIQEALAQIQELEKEEREITDTVDSLAKLPPTSGNLSVIHTPRDKMDQMQERYTQWVRATHPYVDAFRAPILAQFNSQLENSKAAEHFTKWTDRYTLVKSWQFRSGYRFKKTGEKTGKWAPEQGVDPLKMYVMTDAFEKTGQRRNRKGNEPWTKDTPDGKPRAEKMFTMVGMVNKDFEPLFSPVLYPSPTDNGVTAFAQAIFYNANEQKTSTPGSQNGAGSGTGNGSANGTASGAASQSQTPFGWDTLNWDPATPTPEWGSEPSEAKPAWPWEIFSSAKALGSARVKLNWQAKLTPVTKQRLRAAAADQLLGEMRANMAIAAAFYDTLVTH